MSVANTITFMGLQLPQTWPISLGAGSDGDRPHGRAGCALQRQRQANEQHFLTQETVQVGEAFHDQYVVAEQHHMSRPVAVMRVVNAAVIRADQAHT